MQLPEQHKFWDQGNFAWSLASLPYMAASLSSLFICARISSSIPCLGLPVILIGPFLIFSESHMRAVSSDTQFKLFMFPFQYVPDQQQGPQVESSNWKAANAWMPRFPSPLDILDSYILSGLMLVFWLQCVWISASAQATVKGSLLVSSSTFASLDLSVPLQIPLRSLLRDSF